MKIHWAKRFLQCYSTKIRISAKVSREASSKAILIMFSRSLNSSNPFSLILLRPFSRSLITIYGFLQFSISVSTHIENLTK
jgi:hypothetical protein